MKLPFPPSDSAVTLSVRQILSFTADFMVGEPFSHHYNCYQRYCHSRHGSWRRKQISELDVECCEIEFIVQGDVLYELRHGVTSV